MIRDKKEENTTVGNHTDRRDKALRHFADNLHCSQSVLAVFAEECGITEEQAFRLGSCFGSGMRRGNVCGACSGALMVLGLLYGETRKGDPEGRKRTNEGVQYARDYHLFTEFCPKMVASAVEILEEIIRNRQ